MKERPAFIIAATRSGSGKTTLTLGLVAALVKRGLQVQITNLFTNPEDLHLIEDHNFMF